MLVPYVHVLLLRREPQDSVTEGEEGEEGAPRLPFRGPPPKGAWCDRV